MGVVEGGGGEKEREVREQETETEEEKIASSSHACTRHAACARQRRSSGALDMESAHGAARHVEVSLEERWRLCWTCTRGQVERRCHCA